MKLVDILARELDKWPRGVAKIMQTFSGMTFYQDTAGQIVPLISISLADDWRLDEGVTRTQWQAAVDALKAVEVDKAVEWNGEGLPPVGVTCELYGTVSQQLNGQDFQWVKVEIIAQTSFGGDTVAVGRDLLFATLGWGIASAFRPIRNAEQIAAEKYEADAADLAEVMTGHRDRTGDCFLTLAKVVLDAGYRKQEPSVTILKGTV